jgi:hypothetical protein
MSRPAFTIATKVAKRAATEFNSKHDRSLSAPATIFSALARIGLVVMFLAVGAYAQTFSAVNDFSNTINTATSLWSYRYNTTGTRDGNYRLMPGTYIDSSQWYNWGDLLGLAIWAPDPSSSTCPCFFVNKFPRPLISNYGFGPIVLPAQSIFLNPANSAIGDAVLSFRAPETGTVTVNYSFTNIDPYGSTGVNWYIDLNSGLSGDLYSGTVRSTPGNVGTTGEQSFQIAVSQGDRLNFIITGSDGSYSFDSTAMMATITY